MNNSQIIIQYILKYGTAVIFLLLFLEQLNFPGLASSILMPAIGVFVAKYEYSFIYVFIRTLVSLVCGSVKESLIEFLIFSSIGIGIWNLVLMLSGYLTINLINR